MVLDLLLIVWYNGEELRRSFVMDNEPVLYYFVGLPGSGKSFQAKELEAKLLSQGKVVTYLSSDALRGELYGDENCQDNPAFIFEEMKKRTIQALKEGVTVIYDATNMNRKKRMSFLKNLPSNVPCKKVCVVVWARLDTCIQRDAQRDRTVGEKVIMKMVKQFQTPWYDEGWDEIQVQKEQGSYNIESFDMKMPHDNPHHPNTIWQHSLKVVDEVENKQREGELNVKEGCLLTKLAIYHDVGKPLTKSFVNSRGEVTEVAHYYDHQNVSAYLVLGMEPYSLDETPQPGKKTLLLSYLVNMHMEPFFNESNYFKNMDPDLKRLVLLFNECDKRGS